MSLSGFISFWTQILISNHIINSIFSGVFEFFFRLLWALSNANKQVDFIKDQKCEVLSVIYTFLMLNLFFNFVVLKISILLYFEQNFHSAN